MRVSLARVVEEMNEEGIVLAADQPYSLFFLDSRWAEKELENESEKNGGRPRRNAYG